MPGVHPFVTSGGAGVRPRAPGAPSRDELLAKTALARKYRPRSFAEVAAQKHVSDTLRGAVDGGRTAQAYLFCGPRGVGKTTLARVLAMALNCPNRETCAPTDGASPQTSVSADGPNRETSASTVASSAGEPCGECESCQGIWAGQATVDVVEIDAASNRGVDSARDLRERAMYAPSGEARHKVYIVDEAHMLTREAWNALLKILEEPPPGVVFVFATTEPQKIQQSAGPILSRCQRFDFRRISVVDIVERLEAVLASEGLDAEDEALRVIARKAEGGMRDGLSLLDQVLSLAGAAVTADTVRSILGVVDDERFLELFQIVAEHRHAEIFPFVESLADEGIDIVEFYHGVLDVLRILIRVRLAGPGSGIESERAERFNELAKSFAVGDLVRMLSAAAELEARGSLRRSPNPRILVEMLLLRMSYLDRTVEVEELISSLGGDGPSSGSGGHSRVGSQRLEARRTPGAARHATTKSVAGPKTRAGAHASDVLSHPGPRPKESTRESRGPFKPRGSSGGSGRARTTGKGRAERSATEEAADGRTDGATEPDASLPKASRARARSTRGAGGGERARRTAGNGPRSGTTLEDLFELEPGLEEAVKVLDLELTSRGAHPTRNE